ncbi:MAG: ATP-binding protein [Solirubrobacteraceae bacterium]
MKIGTVALTLAKNPYKPGVGTRPPFLAGRDEQLRRFARLVEDYPEKRNNLRITGLRGVGKTVLLKEFERLAKRDGWVVVRRDLSTRLCDEEAFAIAMADYLRDAVDQLSVVARIKGKMADAAKATIGQITLDLGSGVTVSVSASAAAGTRSVLEDRLRVALQSVGSAATGRGVAFLFDEAHTMFDRPKKGQFPLGALLSAFVAAQDDDDEPLPVMLVLCGLPPLIGNIHRARSNAERLFRAEQIANLGLAAGDVALSDAALALVNPAHDSGEIAFIDETAEEIARDVDGYPYFIQWFGEALWDAADVDGQRVIDSALYTTHRQIVQRALDDEFFEPRYRDARRADQGTMRVAAGLGGERFEKNEIDAATQKSSGAIAQSLNRLIADNLLYRDDHGVYAYTAPLFGDFLRRRHPRLGEDV